MYNSTPSWTFAAWWDRSRSPCTWSPPWTCPWRSSCRGRGSWPWAATSGPPRSPRRWRWRGWAWAWAARACWPWRGWCPWRCTCRPCSAGSGKSASSPWEWCEWPRLITVSTNQFNFCCSRLVVRPYSSIGRKDVELINEIKNLIF